MDPSALKQYRKDNKLTQSALASRLDVKTRTVVAWETGQNPVPKWVDERLKGRPSLNPQMSYETFVNAQKKAVEKGQTLEEWIADLIKNAVCLLILAAVAALAFA